MPIIPSSNNIYTTSVSSATTTNTVVWSAWNAFYTSATIVTSATTIWTAWNNTYLITSGTVTGNLVGRWGTLPPVDQARRHEIEGERVKARERAERLLQEHLDTRQKAELASKGFFELDVLSQNGERRRYRIHRQWSHSIHQVDPSNGRRLKTLCIHPRLNVPVEDSMLAQKLMLEGGMEDELLKIANHS